MATFEKSEINRLVNEMNIGNAMIAAGNNNKADHMAAWDSQQIIIENALSGCANLRINAKGWQGTRADFLIKAVAKGFNKATASTQWSKART
jgi:hypothetical protein